MDVLEAWLGQPLPAAFVAALEQHSDCLVESDLLLYAVDELLERNRALEIPLCRPGHLTIGDDSGGRAVVMVLDDHQQVLLLVDHDAMTPDCFGPLAPSLET